ncbi:MAG: DUF4178 domain-containing protein [Elusimicrobiota bacterium]|nr:MAG: DUF4178 domain-containing protein [Elusimicrobiota bacterium]
MMAERFDCPKCKAPLEAHEPAPGVIVQHCTGCSGVLYPKDGLAVPLKLVGATPARFDCPRCRRPMETGKAYDGGIEADRCGACGSIWFDAGEILVLRRLTGVENVAGRPAEDDAEAPAAPAAPAAAVPAKAKKLHPDLPAKADKDIVPPEMSNAQNPDAGRAPTATLDGRVYQHFQTSVPVTTAVYGEFPWIATVGDAARMRDFIDPPYLLSQEITAAETVWSAGEYVEPEEIWAAFALPGSPPSKIGVGPAQPNPWGSQLLGMWGVFTVASAVCIGAYLWLAAAAGNPPESYRGEFDVAAGEAERSRVTEVFELPGGRATNVEVLLDSNLDQQWAYVSLALINADTDQALDFGRELSYYHGYDGGESWSEGSRYATVQVPSVPPAATTCASSRRPTRLD